MVSRSFTVIKQLRHIKGWEHTQWEKSAKADVDCEKKGKIYKDLQADLEQPKEVDSALPYTAH